MNAKTKKLSTIAMMCALSYIVMMVARVPIVLFLKYDPKDVIMTIGGFIFGPLTAVGMSAVVSLLEMLTVSDTGIIGCVMNIVSTCSFAVTASYIYKKDKSVKSAAIGLSVAVLAMVVVMTLWNYLLTPLYMGYPREAVVELLLPAFIPFNVLKGLLNAVFTMLLYTPVMNALRKANILPPKSGE